MAHLSLAENVCTGNIYMGGQQYVQLVDHWCY